MRKIYVLGSINMDLVISAPYMPKSGETLSGQDFFLNPGGKGANQAVACSKQDVPTFLIGNIGKDIFGNNLLSALHKYNVDTTYVNKLDTTSGIAMIIIANGDNRIILDGGANQKVDFDQIEDALSKANENDIFITQLENNLDAVIKGLELAKEKGLVTIFNPAPAINLKKAIYRNVDYLIVNESECEILTGIKPTNEDNALKAYQYLKKYGLKSLIITLGKRGSMCFKGKDFYRIKAHKVEAIDTTAAGDTFVGAFASQLLKGTELKDALNYASGASALTCLKKGAQHAIPTAKEVKQYFNKLK